MGKRYKLLEELIVKFEDKRFYKHIGVDFRAIARAFVVNIKEGRYAQGGSTITQQLARTLYLSNKKTIFRKIVEAIIAVYLEIMYTKSEILQMYIKEVFLGLDNGRPIKGFENASLYYFGKPLDTLNRVETLSLVVSLISPTRYYPGSEKGKQRTYALLAQISECDNETNNCRLKKFNSC